MRKAKGISISRRLTVAFRSLSFENVYHVSRRLVSLFHRWSGLLTWDRVFDSSGSGNRAGGRRGRASR